MIDVMLCIFDHLQFFKSVLSEAPQHAGEKAGTNSGKKLVTKTTYILTEWNIQYSCSYEKTSKKTARRDFPGDLVVKTALAMQAVGTGSLVGELRSHMPCSAVEIKFFLKCLFLGLP